MYIILLSINLAYILSYLKIPFKTFNSDKIIFDYYKKEVLTVNHNTTEKNRFYRRKKKQIK